jgi:hypothetical protein
MFISLKRGGVFSLLLLDATCENAYLRQYLRSYLCLPLHPEPLLYAKNFPQSGGPDHAGTRLHNISTLCLERDLGPGMFEIDPT